MVKKCKVCDNEFLIYPSIQHKKIYCSRDCRIKDTTVVITCLECKKKHNMLKCYVKEKRIKPLFCSDNCYNTYCDRRNYKIIARHKRKCTNCGEIYNRWSWQHSKSGFYYCSQKCSIEHQKGKNHHSWRGGKSFNNGYKVIKGKHGYELEHRLIMENHLGRKLQKKEVVHHKDGNVLNNNIDNLELMSKVEHDRYHTILRHKKEECFGKQQSTGGSKNSRTMRDLSTRGRLFLNSDR